MNGIYHVTANGPVNNGSQTIDGTELVAGDRIDLVTSRPVNPAHWGPVLFEEQPDGSLKISLNEHNPEAYLEVQELIDKPSVEAINDLLEACRMIGNDWYIVPAEDIGALTDSPIIGNGAIYAEEGDQDRPMDYEKVWWFPDYQVVDPIEVLLKYRFVIFQSGLNHA